MKTSSASTTFPPGSIERQSHDKLIVALRAAIAFHFFVKGLALAAKTVIFFPAR
jgi:hypothetical protein